MKGIVYGLMIMLCACAKLPVESVQLSGAIQDEGRRMHALNTALVHTMFSEKEKSVDAFIQNEYTPALAEQFKKLLPADADIKKDLTAIIQYITPAIQLKRDSLLRVLRQQEEKISIKMNERYLAFEKGTEGLKRLLQSAVKVNKARTELYANTKELSGGKIDIERIEAIINDFIRNAGNVTAAGAILEAAITRLLEPAK
jgi:hypothetical protein